MSTISCAAQGYFQPACPFNTLDNSRIFLTDTCAIASNDTCPFGSKKLE